MLESRGRCVRDCSQLDVGAADISEKLIAPPLRERADDRAGWLPSLGTHPTPGRAPVVRETCLLTVGTNTPVLGAPRVAGTAHVPHPCERLTQKETVRKGLPWPLIARWCAECGEAGRVKAHHVDELWISVNAIRCQQFCWGQPGDLRR
ncbi:hypothetical protein MSMEI_1821 [Mycolicibacterium smegmatis MC2 155]|uniref:Uncharacterized protein n=1 Tax=Mycolicibacterium smegmatis (strain ATCC 700084 / mc(2)155) TaxID=246196 RepID=I7FHK6_MYCS2|nr:hypothetical protein MSMEI_1821 [Mycolicibacterium smegmatis MC2 155]